jgi:hypothetical protein
MERMLEEKLIKATQDYESQIKTCKNFAESEKDTLIKTHNNEVTLIFSDIIV